MDTSPLLPPPSANAPQPRITWVGQSDGRDGDGDGVRIHENEREQETTRAVNNWIHMLQKISKDSVVMS